MEIKKVLMVDDEADIVETGVLMAADSTLIKLVSSLVLDSGLHADAALARAAEQIATDIFGMVPPQLQDSHEVENDPSRHEDGLADDELPRAKEARQTVGQAFT